MEVGFNPVEYRWQQNDFDDEWTWCFHSGSRLLQKFDFPSMRFSLYFLGYEDKKEIPAKLKDRTAWTFSRRATIELTQ